jgi:transcriptional regulator with XRE-family HTH domain
MDTNFGERLRSERERLGLTQAEFAKLSGVTGRSQRNYESSDRIPSAKYLEALGKAGVDVQFLISGEASSVEERKMGALWRVIHSILSRLQLGIESVAINVAVRHAEEELDAERRLVPYESISDRIISDMLMEGPALILNPDLFCSVIEKLEALLNRLGRTMPADKKARAIVMLYRASKVSGKIDPKMVEDAVSLAEPARSMLDRFLAEK